MAKRPTCERCQRPQSVCLCPHIKAINNQWPVHILQHPHETKHAIGTAKIAQLSLKHCQTTVCETILPGSAFEAWLKQHNPILVYPGEQANTPRNLIDQPERTLLLVDASWRKSRRMLFESPMLQNLQRVCLQPSEPSRYKIRKTPSLDSLSTLEAIVELLATLENSQEKYQPMLNAMDWMIEKQIEKIGPEQFKKNYTDKLENP
ncbi:MAG: DTW domain-containing protein [Pseudomonadales bacterium]|nr:DTW domain-containing protein [Pseudomonadales bacterium]